MHDARRTTHTGTMPKRARTGQVSEYIPSPFRLTSTHVRCQSNEPVRLAYAKTWLKTAKIAKDKMVVSLALLIVSIAERIERKHNVPGLTSNPKEQANLPFFMRNVWLCLGTNAGLDTVSHQSSSRRKRVKKTQHTRPHMAKPRWVRAKRIVPF